MKLPDELSHLEAAAGWPLGGSARPTPRRGRAGREPLAALALALERTLEDGPPAVAFSGGRDSSLLLAVTALACRRAGLGPPLPITLCMPGEFEEADEDEWQRLVLEHLEIADWQRIPIAGELDLVGPYARRHLLRDGVLFPANVHSVVPMLEAAGKRCLIVGQGGDELLSPQQWRSVHDLLARRRRPEPRDLLRLAFCGVPRPIRRLAVPVSMEKLDTMHWLRPEARVRLSYAIARGFEQPAPWQASVRSLAARRDVVLPLQAMQLLAEAGGHKLAAPLVDPAFVGAFARAGGLSGWGTRTATMDALARDLLPGQLVGRKTKASFNRVFFGDDSRGFAASWSGRGLDETLVDPEALRQEWLSETPDFRTSLLLQSAWLSERALDSPAVDRELDLIATTCP